MDLKVSRVSFKPSWVVPASARLENFRVLKANYEAVFYFIHSQYNPSEERAQQLMIEIRQNKLYDWRFALQQWRKKSTTPRARLFELISEWEGSGRSWCFGLSLFVICKRAVFVMSGQRTEIAQFSRKMKKKPSHEDNYQLSSDAMRRDLKWKKKTEKEKEEIQMFFSLVCCCCCFAYKQE